MTPERAGAGLQGNPVLHIQVIAEARVMMDGSAQPPGSLFRPWDTPESLSPTSSEKTEKSLSPSSSNLLSSNSNSPTTSNPQSLSPTTSNPQSLSPTTSNHQDLSPPGSGSVDSSPGADGLFKVEPLPEPGQGVDDIDFKQNNSAFITDKDPRDHKPSNPQSLSPNLTIPQDLSPTSSSIHSTPDTKDTKSTPGSGSDSDLSYHYHGADGQILFKIEPLQEPGQGVDDYALKQNNTGYVAGKDAKGRKRKRGEKETGASPVLAKPPKSKTRSAVTRGEFPPCGVCGEASTGVHYGAAVCEGCKGFFRRRVVFRDVPALVCGSGGQCSVSGKTTRIHCKLCRYNRCIQIGMKPGAIKQEVKHSSKLTFEEQVLRCHKETLTPLPAIYLARQHTESIEEHVAEAWPVTADLGPLGSPAPGPRDSARFVRGLPGWEELPSQEQQWAATTGTVQVMLLRLLARYRPEVGAFLFPCGKFVYPAQLRSSLPEVTVAHLASLALSLASRGLTQQELSLVSCLLASNPLTASSLYTQTCTAVAKTSSCLQLTDLALQVSELAWTAPPEQWTNISI